MGRPKATKRKDIIPEIDVEKTSKVGNVYSTIGNIQFNLFQGKKINFDDEEELDVKTDEKRNLIEEENEEIGVKTRRSSRKLKVAEESVEIPQKKSKKINKTEDIEQVEPERIENTPNETGNDDEAPELVTAQDNDILKLKKLHEEISLRPKTKKRKREILPKIDTPEGIISS